MSAVGSIRTPLTGGSSHDVLSSKVGDWGYHCALPNAGKPAEDEVPNGFSAKPIDAVVMDYLDTALANANLPVAHLYDSALERIANKITDPKICALLQADLDLRHYLKARRIGDVYE